MDDRTVRQHGEKDPGKDIVAVSRNRRPWVTVKGYPKGTPRTSPSTQAQHWSSDAVFDLVKFRTESLDAELAIGLPDRGATYHRLAERSTWAFRSLPACILWVTETGSVITQSW
jgi:hypothetical protein